MLLSVVTIEIARQPLYSMCDCGGRTNGVGRRRGRVGRRRRRVSRRRGRVGRRRGRVGGWGRWVKCTWLSGTASTAMLHAPLCDHSSTACE